MKQGDKVRILNSSFGYDIGLVVEISHIVDDNTIFVKSDIVSKSIPKSHVESMESK